MYSTFKLAKKYFHHRFVASSGKGHGIHSPFVFDFLTNVLQDKTKYDCYKKIEKIRTELLQNNSLIHVEDYGAGSSVISSNKRLVKGIARSSLKNKKFAQFFYRLVNYYKPQTIVELGTSFGITTSYMAFGNPLSTVYTLEGAEHIALIAQSNFEKLGLKNIQLIRGNFNQSLPLLLQEINKVDLVFVDGNHLKIPTLQYFTWLLEKSTEQSIFIFDDIHWSAEMEEAWKQIQNHARVTLTIDLFFVGLVFFNKDFKVNQHFIIRF
jgi:predicted O-methyltransferase YrrM